MSQIRVQGVDQVFAKLQIVRANALVKAAGRMERFSAEMETEAKNNRPWTDRTGNARRSITGSTSINPHVMRSILAIGVTYGVFLELSHAGRFRIVEPTLMSFRPRFLDGLRGVLR